MVERKFELLRFDRESRKFLNEERERERERVFVSKFVTFFFSFKLVSCKSKREKGKYFCEEAFESR